ncbi:Hal1p NDAI_0C06120 [Naumovozyma dairenensis CBS 421]|uniref:Uncharacterized protein n=1 Tax=Naumovozyma dairenensis (strain ATCC 10597 / BCRC 20456 / CBS 421 / NBRC 0211 / NRRL Y-12639) TaxID=1071378 RepID=G0W910_NAUDC|nr:hypothetical protein NDAI_0C06120 [Naumovozyma dairenensis CBS 421]CCD24271.1 hypothetical protein NDAI_0C06120 [Naumovozyma dairenensis CBS 421]
MFIDIKSSECNRENTDAGNELKKKGYTITSILCNNNNDIKVYNASAVESDKPLIIKILSHGTQNETPGSGLIDSFPLSNGGWCQVFAPNDRVQEGADYFSYCSEEEEVESIQEIADNKGKSEMQQETKKDDPEPILNYSKTNIPFTVKPQFLEPKGTGNRNNKCFPRTPMLHVSHSHNNNGSSVSTNGITKPSSSSATFKNVSKPIIRTPMPKCIEKLRKSAYDSITAESDDSSYTSYDSESESETDGDSASESESDTESEVEPSENTSNLNVTQNKQKSPIIKSVPKNMSTRLSPILQHVQLTPHHAYEQKQHHILIQTPLIQVFHDSSKRIRKTPIPHDCSIFSSKGLDLLNKENLATTTSTSPLAMPGYSNTNNSNNSSHGAMPKTDFQLKMVQSSMLKRRNSKCV